MSQKMLAAVYGVDLRTVSYHITKVFKDAELDQGSVIQKIWIHLPDGRNYEVAHNHLQAVIAIGFKVDNDGASRALRLRPLPQFAENLTPRGRTSRCALATYWKKTSC